MHGRSHLFDRPAQLALISAYDYAIRLRSRFANYMFIIKVELLILLRKKYQTHSVKRKCEIYKTAKNEGMDD